MKSPHDYNYNKNKTIIKQICFGGFLSSLCVIFQGAPILLPVVGLFLAPQSTIPVAFAATINIYIGIFVYISSSFVLLFVSIEEALIFICTTGILGLITGVFIFKKSNFSRFFLTTISLFIGLIILTFVVNISGFQFLHAKITLHILLIIYISFSSIYSIIIFFIVKC